MLSSSCRSVACLYDIHGNLPALDAVLTDLCADPPDAVVVGGDVCAGPMPAEVLARLRDLPWPVHWLRGNADRAVVLGFDGTLAPEQLEHPLYTGDAWAAARLQRADRGFLDGLPALVALAVDGLGDVLFCHATARSDEERVTVLTAQERLAQILEASRADLLVAGYGVAAADAAFHALGYPAADLVFGGEDPDAVAEGFERAAQRPLAPESLISADAHPFDARPGGRSSMIYDRRA